MSTLKDSIMENIVKPHTNMSFGTVLAEVYNYDNITNRAKIAFKDPKGTGFIKLENVPIQLGSGGVHSAGPFVGDHVWVSFMNNSPLYPKIVALADEAYQVNTREKTKHVRKGAFIPDSICERSDYNNTIVSLNNKPTIEDWFDYDNDDYGKYIDYKEENALNTLISETSSSAYYNAEEPGITHPLNSSTIKVRNNGAIDIFVATNQGIRVDPVTKTINFIGNSEKHHVSNLSVFSDEALDITAKKNIDIDTTSCNLNSKEMSITTTGKSKMSINDTWTVIANSDINIKSNANITLESAKDILLSGNRIIFKGKTFIDRDDILHTLNGGD